MRLLELITSISNTDNIVYGKIPLYYLGGSYRDYQDGRIHNATRLVEAAIDKYLPMVEIFKTIDQWGEDSGIGNAWFQTIKDKLDWAIRVLQREDRIIWYMRIVKAYYLSDVQQLVMDSDRSTPEQKGFIAKEYNKVLSKLRKMNTNDAVTDIFRQVLSNDFQLILQHYMGMNIPKINATVWTYQSPIDIKRHFATLEKEWSDKQSQIIDTSEDPDSDQISVVERFQDGSVWVNLNRPSCGIEGDAMGHCGNNQYIARNTQTVLSYRVPVDAEGNHVDPKKHTGVYWRPSLTFILDMENGMLGEMKGRANAKPSKKYHPQITKLLLNPLIKGIAGGGYEAHNNFSLNDLGAEKKKELLAIKPELGSVSDIYKIFGDSDVVRNRLYETLEMHDVSYVKLDADTHKDYIGIQRYDDVDDFVFEEGGETTKYVNGVLFGEIDYEMTYYDVAIEEVIELAKNYYSKHPEEFKALQTYMLNEYTEQFGKDDHGDFNEDVNDVSDIVTVLDEYNDDVYNSMVLAYLEGERVGSENEMYKSFTKWLDAPAENDEVTLLREDFDSPAILAVRLAEVAEWVDATSPALAAMQEEGTMVVGGAAEIQDIQEPYYGWSGYDEGAAIDDFGWRVEIPDDAVSEGVGATGDKESNVGAFLEDLWGQTGSHPFNPNIVLYGSIGMDVSKWGDGVHLGDIVAYGDKGKGHGTQALQLLTKLSDKYGVPIRGTAKAYSTVDGHIQDTDRLVQWYEKNGFTVTGGYGDDYGFDIEYTPRDALLKS